MKARAITSADQHRPGNVAAALLAAALLLATTALPAAELLICNDTDTDADEPIVLPLPPGTTSVRFSNVSDDTWWQLDEAGVELTVEDPEQPNHEPREVGSQPTRLGRMYARAHEGQRIVVTSRPASTTLDRVGLLQLHCRPPLALVTAAHCQVDADHDRDTPAAIEAATSSPDFCVATRLHQAANTALRGGQTANAERLFRDAAERWRAAGEAGREAAARARLAETLWRQSRYQRSLTEAEAAQRLADAAGAGYYAARSHNQRCLALRGLGRFEQARGCVEELPARFQALGELSETANALFNQAAMANEDGRPDSARAALAQARSLPDDALSAMVRGRLAHVEAGLESGAGRVQSALALLENALSHFELAGSGLWQASTYLHAARLHAALGADAEAQLLAESALRIYGELDMAERRAVATLLLARVLAERGDKAAAITQAEQAMALASGTSPQLRLDIALFLRSLQPTLARTSTIEAIIDDGVEWTPRQRFDLAAARAQQALAAGDFEIAATQLAVLEAQIPDLHRRIDHERMRAQIDAAAGRPEAARRRLEVAIEGLAALAADAGTAALRQIAGRRLLALRADWIDTVSEQEQSQPDIAAATAAIVLATDPGNLLRPAADGHDPVEAPAVNEALMFRLADALTGSTGDSEHLLLAQRALWARYASERGAAAGPIALVTAQHRLQRRPPAGTTLLMYGLGRQQSLLVVIDHERIRLHRLASGDRIQHLATRLIELVGNRQTPLLQLDEAARQLSGQLFPDDAGEVPERLLILVDESLAAVPFSLLRWPGQTSTMLETTQISLASASPGLAERVRAGAVRDIDVLFSAAAVPNVEGADLPRLYGAEQEPEWIVAAAAGVTVRTSALTGDALLDRLRSPGAWLHVAGHGTVRDGLQGHAGLWAEPGAAGPAQFISWLDLLDRPLAADLVVLNACALGDTGASRRNRASSFAGALQAAGVEHVVAALWPVSDSAAALWIPDFYHHLLETGANGIADPAAALRSAQLRLRGSRAFRHPFYWASLSHYTALPF